MYLFSLDEKKEIPSIYSGTDIPAKSSIVGAISRKEISLSDFELGSVSHLLNLSGITIIRGTFIPVSKSSRLYLGKPSPWSEVKIIIVFSIKPSAFSSSRISFTCKSRI